MAKRRGNARRNTRRNRRNNMRQNMYGGSELAPVDYSNPEPMALSLAQGRQYGEFHKNQHGGVFSGGPYPGAVTDSSLPADLRASAHLLPLDKAFADVRGLTDQQGGRKRKSRKGRKASRKGRKASRKSRKASHKGSKSRASGKSRKASRKGRKASRKGSKSRASGKNRKSRKYRGGLYRWGGGALGSMSVEDSGKMLLSPQQVAQAGLNPEWKLAEDPMAFAPRR